MRTLNGIIQYMGLLSTVLVSVEQGQEEKVEEELAIKAIRDSNMPKFIADDYKIYEGILDDLFPLNTYEEKASQKLTKEILSNLDRFGLIHDSNLMRKIEDFRNILSVRHAVMLVGEAMTSKSTSVFKKNSETLP